MKKRLLILLVLAIVAGGCVFYFAKRRARQHPLARLAQLPASSKVHRHVSPTGEVVEHVHVYDSPEQSESDGTSGDVVTSSGAVKDYMKMNPIQRAWAQLDLEEIKRKWQPYTIEQMHEMWEQQETLTREAFPETYVSTGMDITDQLRPRDEWLQRYMDLGFPFYRSHHYRGALVQRHWLENYQSQIEVDREHYREWHFSGVSLPTEATWEEYEDTFIKYRVLSEHAHEQYYRENPDSDAAGGVYTLKSGFIPFKSDTVYVHVSEEGPVSSFIGPQLTEAEQDALTMFGIAPRGLKVVYTDKDGVPLPPGMKPRFYERAMKALAEAEKRVEQMIADHDALFGNPPPAHGRAEMDSVDSSSSRRPPSDGAVLDNTELSAAPPDTATARNNTKRDRIQNWFAALREQHYGKLPEDLKELQSVITKLEEIRQQEKERE